MNNELYEDFYNTSMKMIANSNYIEKFYKQLADIELKYGTNSKEYIKLKDFLTQISCKEKIVIKNILNSNLCLSFLNIINSINCNRLIDKINDEYDFSKTVLYVSANSKYEKDRSRIEKYISKEDFVKLNYEEKDKHILRHNIFNLMQSKMYLKVLDNYIANIDDEILKKSLLEEKYSIITRNSALESWYFGLGVNNDCLLIDSDRALSLELGLTLDEYLRLKNNYFENVVEDYINVMISDSLESKDNRIVYEINLLGALLCMNTLYLSNSYEIIEEDILNNPDLYNEDSKELIENVFSKYPILEKKFRVRCPYEEV